MTDEFSCPPPTPFLLHTNISHPTVFSNALLLDRFVFSLVVFVVCCSRRALLSARETRQARFNAGEFPTFLAETASVRRAAWTAAKVVPDLEDRRVEITGPVERKMIINALNSGAKVFMADFEGSLVTHDNNRHTHTHTHTHTHNNLSPYPKSILHPPVAQQLITPPMLLQEAERAELQRVGQQITAEREAVDAAAASLQEQQQLQASVSAELSAREAALEARASALQEQRSALQASQAAALKQLDSLEASLKTKLEGHQKQVGVWDSRMRRRKHLSFYVSIWVITRLTLHCLQLCVCVCV